MHARADPVDSDDVPDDPRPRPAGQEPGPRSPDAPPPDEPARAHALRNGVDTTALFATIDALERRSTRPLWFAVTSRWVSGTHSQSTVHEYGADGAAREHLHRHVLDADLPGVLAGTDVGPTPFEYLLHALASCVTSGIALAAAAWGVRLDELACTATGHVDARGVLGRVDEVGNGVVAVAVDVHVRGDEPEALRALAEQSWRRSVVHAALAHGMALDVRVDAG
jgi:uncharacterized OsmC-like protein